MSKALLRRNSSKQGLQALMRMTAQRSVEDAEEAEREQRRRTRDASRWSSGGSPSEESAGDGESVAEENDNLKPRSSPSLEEDEGFSDWTQRRQRRRQQMEELHQGGQREVEEESAGIPAPSPSSNSSPSSSGRLQEPETEEQDAGKRVGRSRRDPWEMVKEENQRADTEVEPGQGPKESWQEHQEPTTSEGAMSRKTTRTKRFSRSMEPEEEEVEATRETERCLEKIRQGLQQKESQELEQLRQRQAEAEQELEELQRRREERRRLREEEELHKEEVERQRLAKEEEEKRRMKKDMVRRRMEAAERVKIMSSADGDENFSPLSPRASTHKITERTESLNRSLRKSNSFKKAAPLVLVPKIDDKVEQYVHAVENAQEQRSQKVAPPSELLASPEVIVAAKKNLFEAGEAGIQSPSRPPGCKDTDGLKVGVANLITQWVKGPSDSGRQSAAGRPADVKPGDVMQKKNLWEGVRETSASPQGAKAKGAAAKKYKFVITGHGKYEKVAAEDGAANGKSGSLQDS